MWNIKVKNQYYVRGYTQANVILAGNAKYAKDFNSPEKATNVAEKVFDAGTFEIVPK